MLDCWGDCVCVWCGWVIGREVCCIFAGWQAVSRTGQQKVAERLQLTACKESDNNCIVSGRADRRHGRQDTGTVSKTKTSRDRHLEQTKKQWSTNYQLPNNELQSYTSCTGQYHNSDNWLSFTLETSDLNLLPIKIWRNLQQPHKENISLRRLSSTYTCHWEDWLIAAK